MSDERDLRDPAIDALLRTHSSETPPPAIDAAILAAAHRAVEAPPRIGSTRATPPWRWWMPIAAAAAIGVIVLGIFPLAPTLVEPPARMTRPSASNAEHGGANAPAPERPLNQPLRDFYTVKPQSAAPKVSETAQMAAAPPPTLGDRREKSVPSPQSVDDWIAQIRALRNEARISEAIRALAAFRAAVTDADARLPEDLREWAKTVR